MNCAEAGPLLGSLPGELDAALEAGLAAHLEACDACQARLADVEALSVLVREGLAAEAARRDLAPLADAVLARIPASAWRAPSGAAAPGGLRGFFRRHRILAAAGALAPALAALALYLYIGGASGPVEPGVVVTSDDLAPVVLETSDGPVILVGDGADGT